MRHAFSQVLYRICGRTEGSFRVLTGTGDLLIGRRQPLPLLELQRAATVDSAFALDPRLPRDGATTYLALWTYASSYEDVLACLPELLHPQLAIATAAGVAMVWIPRTPCLAGPDAGTLDAAVLLGAIADALNTVPPGPEDGIPLPRSEADLVTVTTDTFADLEALWGWARQVLVDRQHQAAVDDERGDSVEAYAAAEVSERAHDARSEEDVPEDLLAVDPWSQDAEGDVPVLLAARPIPPRDVAVLPVAEGSAPPAVDVPPQLTSDLLGLIAAVAHRSGGSRQAVLVRAVVAHAMATLGSADVYALLGVRLTWARPDGLYGLADGEWKQIG